MDALLRFPPLTGADFFFLIKKILPEEEGTGLFNDLTAASSSLHPLRSV